MNVGRCEAWPCRTDSAVTCSDDKVVCEVFETAPIDCSGIVIQVDRVTTCSCSCGAEPIIINGLVLGSDTNAALEGINVERNGQTTMYITDDNGEFTFSVPSTIRRLILKATDPNNNYIKAFHIVDILPNYQDPVSVVVTMVKRAPFIQIDSTQENELSISGSPSEQDTGVASMTIPANAFFTSDGLPYTGEVSVSLTYLDPHDPDMLALAPGRFVTIDSNGEEFVLITQGVFSLSAVDNTGNELVINGEIGVSGKAGFALWALDSVSATWIENEGNPGRKRRQLTQQQYLGSFNPQNVDWWNIDKVLTEPDCFFRVRVFQDSIAPSNEVVSGLLFQPYVTQFLASGTDLVTYRSVLRSSPCVNIKCPAAEAQLTIRIRGIETVYGLAGIEVSILPANITEYSTGIKSVLEATPYFYSLLENTTDTMFVNTQLSMSGPFYPTEQTCLDATINDPAFWFTKRQAFVEGDFDDSFEGRCVAKLKIQVSNSLNASIVAAENLTAVSSWGDNMFSIRTGELNYFGMGGPWTIYDSCIEYRCSRSNGTHNDTTRVDLGTFQSSFCFSNFQHLQKRMGIPGATFFNGPILDPAALPSGFYYSNTTNVQPAMSDCLSGANYIGTLSCLNSTTNG